MKETQWGIHWFRRDLRVFENEALLHNYHFNQGKTLGLFCFDSKFLSRSDFSNNRFSFFLKTLGVLREEFRSRGGELLIIDCEPLEAFSKLLDYCQTNLISPPSLITWGRDYEPFARKRDSEVENWCRKKGIEFRCFRDHLLFEPHEILKENDSKGPYQIFSPFFRKWLATLNSVEGRKRLELAKSAPMAFAWTWTNLSNQAPLPFSDAFSSFSKQNEAKTTIDMPDAGFQAAMNRLQKFKEHIAEYSERRNSPSADGTSQLSIYLKNGSLTVPLILSTLDLKSKKLSEGSSLTPFVRQLAWREFYYSILYHRPDLEEHCFLLKYDHLKWQNDKHRFARWKEGTTGFPIIDAGMRELQTTGLMHNRVRMIVASFLTKDLLIDWKWGEKYFMQYLLDGDLAANNGGWQWAASTGCDPQPYFRIFNPWLQSQKFDPEGTYIKRYVPELRDAPARSLHGPNFDRSRFSYPPPMIDHSVQSKMALLLYKQVLA